MFLLLKIQSVLLSFFPPGGGHFSQKLKTLKQSFWLKKKKVAWHHSQPKTSNKQTIMPDAYKSKSFSFLDFLRLALNLGSKYKILVCVCVCLYIYIYIYAQKVFIFIFIFYNLKKIGGGRWRHGPPCRQIHPSMSLISLFPFE